MSYTVSPQEENRVRLTITVDPQDFAVGMDAAYRKMAKRVEIHGFRKGKAPRSRIEALYGGPSVFYEDAFDHVYPIAYRQAVEAEGLRVVSQPEIHEVTTINQEEGCVFSVDVWVYPTVTLGQYKNLPVEKQVPVVDDAEVNADIDRLRQSRSRLVEVDRAIETDDTVTFDFEGRVDGELFEGGASKNYELVIGSGRFIPGFEDQMIGMTKGQTADLKVTFPDEYAPELAGRDAVFTVTVHNIRTRELPEWNDEFCADATGTENCAQYESELRERLAKQATDRAEGEFEQALLTEIANNATLSIPGPMAETAARNMVQDMAWRVQGSGLNFEQYLQYTGQTIEGMLEQYKEPGEKQVKIQVCLSAIREAEGIEATAEQVDARIAEYATQTGKSVEDFAATLSEDDREAIAKEASMQATVDAIKEWSKDYTAAPKLKKAAAKPKAEPKAAKPKADDAGETADAPAKPKKAPAKKPAKPKE